MTDYCNFDFNAGTVTVSTEGTPMNRETPDYDLTPTVDRTTSDPTPVDVEPSSTRLASHGEGQTPAEGRVRDAIGVAYTAGALDLKHSIDEIPIDELNHGKVLAAFLRVLGGMAERCDQIAEAQQ